MTDTRAAYTTPQHYKAPSGEELRALLRAWRLTGAAAGALVDLNSRQIRRYTGDEQRVPYGVLYTLASKCEDVKISIAGWRAELSSALERGRQSVGSVE